MWNFRGSWFLTLKLPKGVNVAKFLGVFSGFSKGKVTNLKILACFFRKVYPQLPPPHAWILSLIAQSEEGQTRRL